MQEEKAKGNLKEHVCLVQRAVLGSQGWTRSALQSCTPAYSCVSLWQQLLRDTAAPHQHTHGLTDVCPDPAIPDDSTPFHVNPCVCCQQAWVITTLSTAWCVPHLLKVIYCSFRKQDLFNRCFCFQVDTLNQHLSHTSFPFKYWLDFCNSSLYCVRLKSKSQWWQGTLML